jgi:hypothetical protein
MVVVASVLVLEAVKLVTVVVASVVAPETFNVLENVAAPVTAKVLPAVAAPVKVVAPLTDSVVAVVVASVEVLEAVKFVTVVVAKVATPETVSAPDRLRLAPVIEPVTARLVDVAFVNTPVLGVVAPIEVPLIVPPEIVTLLDVRLVMVWFVPVAEVYVKFVLFRLVEVAF